MVTNANEIVDEKLRSIVIEIDKYLRDLMDQSTGYSFRKMISYRDKLVNAFNRYINGRRKEIGDLADGYDVKKKDVEKNFRYDEENIKSTFERNVIRAFGQATYSIEKTLGENLSNPGLFGIRALSSILKKKPKVEDLARVEGFSRLTSSRRIYTIDLIPYLVMLLRTAQEEWARRVNTSISITTQVDLARISPHPCWLGPRADEVCNRWRDRIVSLYGLTDGFPRLDDAKAERPPLFHPHCTHKAIPLTQYEESVAIKRKIKTYETLKKYI